MKMRVLSAPLWASSPSHTAPGAAKSHCTGPIPPVRISSAHQADHPREGKRAQKAEAMGKHLTGRDRGTSNSMERAHNLPGGHSHPATRAIFQLLT